MKIKSYRYSVKVGNSTYIVDFISDTIEKIFDYYKVEYKKI